MKWRGHALNSWQNFPFNSKLQIFTARWFLVGDLGKVSEVPGLSYQMEGENVSPHVRYVVARGEGSLNEQVLQPQYVSYEQWSVALETELR